MYSHEYHIVSNHRQFGCLFNSLFSLTTKTTSKLHITDPLCHRWIPSPRVGNAESVLNYFQGMIPGLCEYHFVNCNIYSKFSDGHRFPRLPLIGEPCQISWPFEMWCYQCTVFRGVTVFSLKGNNIKKSNPQLWICSWIAQHNFGVVDANLWLVTLLE